MAISFMTSSVDRPVKGGGKIQSFPMEGSTHLYKGQIVSLNGDGYLVRGADALNLTFAGVAYEEVNNTGGDAAKWCRVYRAGIFKFTAFSAVGQPRMLERMYAADDNQVEEWSGDAHLLWVGVNVECDPEGTGTYVWVDIEAACQQGCQAGAWVDPGSQPS